MLAEDPSCPCAPTFFQQRSGTYLDDTRYSSTFCFATNFYTKRHCLLSNPRHYLYTLYDPLFVRRIDGFADKLRPVSVDFNSPTYVLHTYSHTYLCAITENGRGTLENKKVPFPICPRCTDPLPRCFAICIGLQCAACCFVSYAALSRVHVRDLSGFARQRFPYQIFISRMPVNRRRTRHRTAILGVYYVGII